LDDGLGAFVLQGPRRDGHGAQAGFEVVPRAPTRLEAESTRPGKADSIVATSRLARRGWPPATCTTPESGPGWNAQATSASAASSSASKSRHASGPRMRTRAAPSRDARSFRTADSRASESINPRGKPGPHEPKRRASTTSPFVARHDRSQASLPAP
jgi:hypothetical protein